MKKIKVLLLFISFIVVICFIFVIFPLLCNFLMNISSSFGYVTYETKSAWIGYIGAAMGGAITLIGVILTLVYNEQVRAKTFNDNLKLTNEQLRLEKLPYLTFEIIQKENFDDLKFKYWRNIAIGENGLKDIYVYILISNRGVNVAKNVKVQIIVDDVLDQGQIELCQEIIQVNETRDTGMLFRCNEDYVLSNDNQNVNIKLIFFYEDILGNCYIQECFGNVHFLCCDDGRNDTLCVQFFSVKDSMLTKIKYYYISEKDVLKKEKEKRALREANDMLNKSELFNRKKELDEILLKFNTFYYIPKMDKLIEYIKNKEKNEGGGGEGQTVFTVLSDSMVSLKIDGGFSFGEKELIYSYNLEVELDKKIVTFNKFNIINKKKITLIQLIKIKLMFRSKKVKCD